jgi:hypothetical protein
MIKNFFIIILVTLSFSVALFEKQIFPFFKMKTYDKEIFGFEKDFGPRWVPFFPFSSMPMYSESYDPAYVTQLEILGVTSQGEEIVLPIRRYFFPLWTEALREIFINHRLNEMPTKHFFTLFFKLYEYRRTAKASTLCVISLCLSDRLGTDSPKVETAPRIPCANHCAFLSG